MKGILIGILGFVVLIYFEVIEIKKTLRKN